MNNIEKEKSIKQDTTRVILNVPNSIDEKFRELANKRGLTKSNMIIYAMSWYLDYNKSMDMMPKMLDVLKSVDSLEKLNTQN